MLQNNSHSRANILQKIEAALQQKTPQPFNHNGIENSRVVASPTDSLINQFSNNFTALLGNIIITQSQAETTKQLMQLCQVNNWQKIYCAEPDILNMAINNNWLFVPHADLATCDISITSCEFLIARTGSIMLSSALPKGRTASVYAPIHVCLTKSTQLVFDIKDALLLLETKYGKNIPSLVSLATGPSRTADIEKTLVVGVHGPKEVFCIIES